MIRFNSTTGNKFGKKKLIILNGCKNKKFNFIINMKICIFYILKIKIVVQDLQWLRGARAE